MNTTALRQEPNQALPARVESEYLSPAGRKMRDEVAALAPLILKSAAESELIGSTTPQVLEALGAVGYFGISMPIEFGGAALGARDITEVITAASMADGSVGWMGFVAGGIRNLLTFPERAIEDVFGQSRTWVGPLAVGASVFSPVVGDARIVDDGFMVKGKWFFASGCKHARWAVVGIGWDDRGAPRRGMAILSSDQYEIVDDWHVMGLKATSSNSITAREEVFVPAYRTILAADFPMAMEALRGRYQGLGYRTSGLGLMLVTCLSNVSIALGMAKGCLRFFIEQVKARKPFNLPYDTIADAPSTQVTAGYVHAMIGAAEAVIHRIADEVDRRALADQDFLPQEESLCTMELVYAANLCGEAIDKMQLCLGSSTVSLKNPIQRFARDVRVLLTHGAIRQDPSAEIAGRNVLGLPPLSMFAGGLVQR
jgi:indole-3-acetate monooxygenase